MNLKFLLVLSISANILLVSGLFSMNQHYTQEIQKRDSNVAQNLALVSKYNLALQRANVRLQADENGILLIQKSAQSGNKDDLEAAANYIANYRVQGPVKP